MDFEARQIRSANPGLYLDLRAGRRSLYYALSEIGPQRELRSRERGLGESGYAALESLLDRSAIGERPAQSSGTKGARGPQKPVSKVTWPGEKLSPTPSAAVVEKALARLRGFAAQKIIFVT